MTDQKTVLFLYRLSHQYKLFSFLERNLPESVRGRLVRVKSLFSFGIGRLIKAICATNKLEPEKANQIINFTYLKVTAGVPWLKYCSALLKLGLKYRSQLYYRLYQTLFQESRVDLLVVWNGLTLEVAAAVQAARDCRIKLLFCENGYLPKTIVMDPAGVNAVNSLVGKTQEFYEAVEVEQVKLTALFESRLQQRPLKNKAGNLQERLKQSEEDLTLPERFIFLPLQVHDDSQILLYSPRFKDMPSLIEYCAEELNRFNRENNQQYRLVVKEHPSDFGRINYQSIKDKYREVLFVRTINTQELLESCGAVITVNSTVGIEGLFCFKPVITLGEAFYNVPSLVEHLGTGENLAQVLRKALSKQVDRKFIEKFLYYLRFKYLVSLDRRNLEKENPDEAIRRILDTVKIQNVG